MREKSLYVIGKGGGCNQDDRTNLISVAFDYHGIMNIGMARQLIVESATELLNLINSNPDQEQYVEKFPVPIKFIDIGILGDSSDYENFNFVKTVFTIQGSICYCTEDLCVHPYPIISKETFSEAQGILAHPDEIHRRTVTSIEKDQDGNITELSGPWGMVIEGVAIDQIESGQFEYYVIKEGVETPFKVVEGVLRSAK